MPTIEFQGDDAPAIDYIRQRGYASYSSLKNVRDREIPQVINAKYLTFGKELHSRFLENKKLETMDEAQEKQVDAMIKSLRAHPVVKLIMKGAKTEVKFHQKLNGVWVLGYIDILNFDIADLKTTRLKNFKQFAASMDFLQAALYLAVTKKKDFHYIGICKEAPYEVIPFSVRQFPDRLEAAKEELNTLLAYLKKKL
jgi:hypothetical protein